MSQQAIYAYTVVQKRHNSETYGHCEVCNQWASEIHHQIERRQYTRFNGTEGWTHHQCHDKFGHLECLQSIRRGPLQANRKVA